MRSELLRVPQVGKVDLIGAQDEVVYLDFSTRQIAGLGVSTEAIAETLRSQNAVIASGTLDTSNERVAIRVSGQFDSVANLEEISVPVNNRLVRLKDIATIRRGYDDPPAPLFRVNGAAAIGLGISMAKGENIEDLGAGVEAEMERIVRDLPAGIDPHLVADQPEVVKESVGEFTGALGEAIIIVLIVSFLSLGLRAGVVVAVCIPLVLAATFVIMRSLDIDLQRISLGALVIGLGLLVDDAMIAVEMMVRKLDEGWDRVRAATFAYTSTAFPMLTGTLVTIAGFLPVGFAKSGAGEYCFTMFVVLLISLVVSWFVAIIFAPYVGSAILKEKPESAGHGPHHGRLEVWFRGVLLQSMQRRKLVLIATAAAFVVAVVLFRFVAQEFFPSADRAELLVDLKLPQNASIAATLAEAERFEKVLKADPDVVSHTFYVGSGAVRFYLPLNLQLPNANIAQAVVVTKSYEVRDQVRARLEKAMEQFPSLQGRVAPLQLGPPVDWPLQYRVMGEDVAAVREIADRVAGVLRANPNTRIVNFDWYEMSKSVLIDIDQDEARLLGVTSEQLAAQLNAVLTGRAITQLRDDIYLIEIRGRAQPSERGDLQALRDLEIAVGPGRSVPLAQFAQFRYGLEESIIWRRERLPTMTAQADVVPGIQPATVVLQLQGAMDQINAELPPGYRLEVGGVAGESAKGQASIIAVVPMMFIVPMIQLQSVQKLVIVMLTAPLGLIGVVLALLLSGRPFGFVAMLGVFALTGMIIRNAVVLIAQIVDNENEGMNRWDAIVDATMHRMRPILLTAAAAILGLIPIAGSVFWGPMSFAMMGGLLVATVLTLIFVPALYAVWYRVAPPQEKTAAA